VLEHRLDVFDKRNCFPEWIPPGGLLPLRLPPQADLGSEAEIVVLGALKNQGKRLRE
jgi:hypothetical protein